MGLEDFFAKEEEQAKKKYPITDAELRQIEIGSHRVDDFIIYPCNSITYRDPYSFVYLKEGETHPYHKAFKDREYNPMGYCPFLTQFALEYLLASAKNYLIGCKYTKESYKLLMELWKKKKKKSAKDKPQKSGCYFPIAKNSHFFIEVEGLGMFYYQMVYQRRKK